MLRSPRAMLSALTLTALACVAVPSQVEAAHPDIFYNQYVGPSPYGGGVPAQMYVSPRPSPPYVGHTWITYPPLSPHEFMYHHHRKYHKYYRGGGYTESCVRYKTHLWPF
ncbi:MAG: hypothetical protein AB7O59_16320 [Pirellulales bacterium]